MRSELIVAAVLLSALAGCAKSKPTEATPAASASVASPAPLASARPPARTKLCSDGVHRPGDHWKEACNPCRCALDGEITCARFPCGEGGAAAPADAGTAP